MERKIIEHANLFLSYPMTLDELSKRTATKQEVLIKEFKCDLYFIDVDLAVRVGRILNYLEKHHKVIC